MSSSKSNSLLAIVLDISPLTWGERDLRREASDKQRTAVGKGSVGPARLKEMLESIEAFCIATTSIERSCGILLIAVADNESAVIYPRKDELHTWLSSSTNTNNSTMIDTRKLRTDLYTGVHELMQRAAIKAPLNSDPCNRQGAMAAAFSKALCWINRCLVAAQTGLGISALQTTSSVLDRGGGGGSDDDDNGIIALSNKKNMKKKKNTNSAWSPRILLIQASEDRSRDYNALMNCAFAAMKQNTVVDGCYLATAQHPSSSFLEQICDLTNGVYLAPSGAAQVGGALTEILYSVFLPPLSSRNLLNLPALHKVDFRAKCFDTDNDNTVVDMAYVCNQCLSIFKNKPITTHCPTCQAKIVK